MNSINPVLIRLFVGIFLATAAIVVKANILTFNTTMDVSKIPADIVVSQDGSFVYVASSLNNAIDVYQRVTDTALQNTNTLQIVNIYIDNGNTIDGLAQPWKIALSPAQVDNNQFLFVVAKSTENDPDTLAVYERNSIDGSLILLDVLEDTGALNIGKPSDIAISPDGNQIYVTGGESNTVAVFEFNASAQATESHLNLIESKTSADSINLNEPQSIVVSPDGIHVYVAATASNSILVYTRDTVSGVLDYQAALEITEGDVLAGGALAGMLGPIDMQISPDGNNIYVASFAGNSVVVFSRNNTSGALDYVETYSDGGLGINTVTGLEGITALRMSPDGDYVAVMSGFPNLPNINSDLQLTVFYRDMLDGRLAKAGPGAVIVDDGTGSAGIVNSFNFAFTADNQALYTAASTAGIGKIGIFDNCLGLPATVNIVSNLINNSVVEGSGQIVELDASGSAAPACESVAISEYSWQQVAGPVVDLQGASGQLASFLSPDNISENTDLVFELTVTTNKGVTNTGSVTINVLNANLPPVANNDLCIIEPGSTVSIDVLANDTDPDGPPPLMVVDSSCDDCLGAVAFDSQAISYTPPVLALDINQNPIPVIETIAYSIADSPDSTANQQLSTAQVQVMVNELPEPLDDEYNNVESSGDTPHEMDILVNDIYVNQNAFIVLPENRQTDQGGTLELVSGGSVKYFPPASNTAASDSFLYTVISAETKAFADANNLELVSNNPTCLQGASTGKVTINFKVAISQKPDDDDNRIVRSGGGGGGGSLLMLDLLLASIVFVRVIVVRIIVARRKKLGPVI